jgi:SulP family sulfate permease
MVIIPRFNPRLPAGLITVILITLVVRFAGLEEHGVRLVSAYGLPESIQLSFHLPEFSLSEFPALLVPGLAVALFGLMETVSITKAMSQITGERPDPSREMIGQGLASFAGGFFYCMPSSGSPSRTVINVTSGAKTRLSAVFSGLGVLVFIRAASSVIGYIPMAALGAVVVVSSAGLINIKLIHMTWQSRITSRVIMSLTFISALILPLEYSIIIGAISSLLIFLGESSLINLSYIKEDENGQFVELPITSINQHRPEIVIVNVEGNLYFAAIEGLQKELEDIIESRPKALILRFRRTHLFASTGAVALKQFVKSTQEAGIHVLLCGVHKEMLETLETAGILDSIGQTNVFTVNNQILDSTHEALNKAKYLLSSNNNKSNNKSISAD